MGSVKAARALHLLEIALDLDHPLLDEPTVSLDLRLARAAEEAETAALALQMGPGPHEPRFLIGEMRKLHLQHTFTGLRSAAEDVEDQPRAVDHLAGPRLFKVALLHGGQRRIHHDKRDFLIDDQRREFLDLALAEIGRGARARQRDDMRAHHIKLDGAGQPDSLIEPRIRGA
jgi:hypothetical protein